MYRLFTRHIPHSPRKQAHGLITEFWTFVIFSISKQLSFISPWAYKNVSPSNTVKEAMTPVKEDMNVKYCVN